MVKKSEEDAMRVGQLRKESQEIMRREQNGEGGGGQPADTADRELVVGTLVPPLEVHNCVKRPPNVLIAQVASGSQSTGGDLHEGQCPSPTDLFLSHCSYSYYDNN